MKLIPVALAALLVCGSAQATTLRFDAYSRNPASWSDFSILFEDANDDSLLAFDEIVAFSGFTCSFIACTSATYDTVRDIPYIVGFTSGTGPIPDETWQFTVGGDPLTGTYPLYANDFTYAISQVPVPASALLLISAIGSVAAFGRRKLRTA